MTTYHNKPGFQPFRTITANNTNRSARRLDANSVALLGDDLKYVSTKTHDYIKSNLVLLNLFPVEEVDPGANTYGYRMGDGLGVGTYGATKADDVPLVSSITEQFDAPMGTIDIAMQVSEGDMEAALMAKSNNIFKLRDQCVRGLYETMEDTLLNGYKPLGLKGLMSYDAGNTAVASNWYTGTAEQIYTDVSNVYNTISRNTNGNIRPNTMLISPALYTVLSTKLNVIGNSLIGTNVLDSIASRLKLNIVEVPKLDLAFSNKTRDGFFLLTNGPEFITHPVSIMFDAAEPQRNGWIYTTYCRSKHGSLISLHPRTIVARAMTVVPV